MKKLIPYLLILIVLVVGVVIKAKYFQTDQLVEKTSCYLSVTEGSGLTDIHYIEFTLGENNSVTGFDNWLPEAKDSNTGDFSGYIKDGDLTVVFNGSGEGQTWKEERRYRINDDNLLIGYSTTGVYEDENGVFRPNADSTINYSQSLPKIPCDSIDKEKVFLK